MAVREGCATEKFPRQSGAGAADAERGWVWDAVRIARRRVGATAPPQGREAP